MGNQHTKEQDTVIHVRVTETERRKMAQRALSEHRPLANWARVQLLKAFEPKVDDAMGKDLLNAIAATKVYR